MKSMLHNASGSIARVSTRAPSAPVALRQRSPFICLQCEHRTLAAGSYHLTALGRKKRVWQQESHRGFSWTTRRRQDDVKRAEVDASKQATQETAPREQIRQDISTGANGTIQTSANEQLPSHRERIRWRISQRMNQLMDDLMPKLALASQRINTYTGTDYSGIESLRQAIIEQGMLPHMTPRSSTLAKT